MIIDKIKGNHSLKDEIILITTTEREVILLKDCFELIYAFAKNELNRIRNPFIRNEIIKGDRPFLFEDEIKKAFDKAKEETELEIKNLKGGGNMKDEFKSEYVNFENGKTIRLEMVSDETKVIRTKNDGSNKQYEVYEFKVLDPINKQSKKISLFKSKIENMYKLYDEKSGKDNKSLIGCVFDLTQTITEVEGKKVYNLDIKLINCPVEKVL